MKLTKHRHKALDGRILLSALIGLVFLGLGDLARAQGITPTIERIFPDSAIAGIGDFNLTVYGNFSDSSVVRWNGSPRRTVEFRPPSPPFVSQAALTARISTSDVATTGAATVTVFTSFGFFGFTSNSLVFRITAPRITAVTPSSALAGGGDFDLAVQGENFSNLVGSAVRWNGSFRPTSFICVSSPIGMQPSGGDSAASSLTALPPGCYLVATIAASDIATTGTATITFVTPGGAISNGMIFTIIGPTITAISPTSALAGGSDFDLTVIGNNLIGSTVRWNGSPRVTSLVGDPEFPSLRARILARDITTAGTATITVVNAEGGSSNPWPFRIIAYPQPTISSISPSQVPAGGPGLTLTVNGSNFRGRDPDRPDDFSRIRWNGAERTTDFVDGRTLTILISAADIARAGIVNITVFTPGAPISNTAPLTIENPVPQITNINPDRAPAGDPAFTLRVTGTGFVSGSVVWWNNAPRPTTLLSSAAAPPTLSVAIPAGDIAMAGIATVTVFNPPPGGGPSKGFPFTILGNPVPKVSTLEPASRIAGGPAFILTVNGSDFVRQYDLRSGGFVASVVRWNNEDRTTNFVSDKQLTAEITARDIAAAGTAGVTVFNPAPGGGTSNAVSFTIIATPVITSLDPASALAGGPDFTLTVNGSGFVGTNGTPGSVVRWNNSNRTTMFVSATRLTAAITAADIATAGTATVSVFNPAPGGGRSNEVGFAIRPRNQPPSITSLSPSFAAAGSPAFTLTVIGTNFVDGSVVRWNDADRPTTFFSSTVLTAAIQVGDIATVGTASVTVFNPEPGGGTSDAVSFSITAANPTPTITSLGPAMAVAGSPGFTLTITGTNFVTGSEVRWNQGSRSTTFVSSTQLTAQISANDIAAAGSVDVTVFNPAPVGGTSNAARFTIRERNPVPTITALNPAVAVAGSSAFTLTIIGTDFVTESVVRWNNDNRSTTLVSSTQLMAEISPGDIAMAGTANVTVFNPAPGGGTSNAAPFMITNPVPTITGLGPASADAGSPAITLTVTGTDFVSGSQVRWNGANRTTTFVGNTQLTAAIPASDLAAAVDATVTVFNPAPGGGVSNARNFSVMPLEVTLGGVDDSLNPREQVRPTLTLSKAQTGVTRGQLVLTFTADAVNPIDDPAIRFMSTGTRTLNFSFPADSTGAVFDGITGSMFQTGSVAGTINLSVLLEGVLNTSRNITVRRQAPMIVGLPTIVARTASSFDIVIVGLSNTRALSQADFRFTARGGGNLATSQVTVNLTNDANTWYQGEASTAHGSQFTLTVSFTVQGGISAIGSVSVTLSNGEGTSTPSSASF